MFASVPDLLRLLALPFFGYVAWRDVETRRVPNRTWIPLGALALVLLAWETYTALTGDVLAFRRQQFLVRVLLSVGFIVPLSYIFWRMGGFGGADAKAFFVVAVLFPTYPDYHLREFGVEGALAVLPAVGTPLGVFSITVLSNTVLAGALYPVALAGHNALSGYISPGMFIAKPLRPEEVTTEYGSVLQFPDRSLRSVRSLSGLRSYFAWRSLDLDALRMYLEWRGLTLAELRAEPGRYRDPATLPEEPNPPGDGSLATDGGGAVQESPGDGSDADDPWGAETFLAAIDGSAYGTTPGRLREGLEVLTGEDVVWVSPGIPFLVPLFVGLLVAFSYGDVLFALLEAVGFSP